MELRIPHPPQLVYLWFIVLFVQCCQQPDSDIALTFKLTQRLQVCRRQRERLVHKDITLGREATAITAVNMVDDADFPTDFVYVADYVETMAIPVNRVITSLQVCII